MKLNPEVSKAKRKMETALKQALAESKRTRLAIDENGAKPDRQLGPFTVARDAMEAFLLANSKAYIMSLKEPVSKKKK